MVKKTNTTKVEKNTVKDAAKEVNSLEVEKRTLNDFKNAVLGVSLFINAFIFTAWLTVQVTDRYNADVIAFLLR